MNIDDKMKGKMNEVGGKMTDDKSQEMKGKAQQTMGDMKDKFEHRDSSNESS